MDAACPIKVKPILTAFICCRKESVIHQQPASSIRLAAAVTVRRPFHLFYFVTPQPSTANKAQML